MPERPPLVLLLAREGVMHHMLTALLGDACALVGARTKAAAHQVARRRPPDVVLVDDSFDDLDGLMAGLREAAGEVRAIVLATPNRPGTRLAHLAVLGPVITKPFNNEQLRNLVLATAHLSRAAREGEAVAPSERFTTTKVNPSSDRVRVRR